MKRKLQRLLSVLLVVLTVVSMIPLTAVPASAANGVKTRLDEFKNSYPPGNTWTGSFNGAIQCNGFGKMAIYNVFGKSGNSYRNWNYDCTSLTGMVLVGSITSFSSGNVQSLLSKARCGDILQFNTPKQHTMIVYSVGSSSVWIYDCNWDNACGIQLREVSFGKWSSRNSTKLSLIRADNYDVINGSTPVTHTVNSSYGTNFTAYPKEKITAGNIFDANHNQISSTSWIGTSDKCTIHEVYTDGCCKVTYPLDNGGTKTVYSKISLFNVPSQEHADTPSIHCWISDSEYGESCSEFKIGNRYYLCYRLYDRISGKDWDDVKSSNYSVRLTFYNPDGSVMYTNTNNFNDDQSWISQFFSKAGTYKYSYVVEGDYVGSSTKEFTVIENPIIVNSSTQIVTLKLGETESQTIYARYSGYYSGNWVISYNCSNSNISCTWGDWTDDNRAPLTIKAKAMGTTTLTISIKDKDTGVILDSTTVAVKVGAKSYTVTYNANGGNDAPENQTKYHNTTLTLSSTKPTRIGYTFLGWSTSSTATSATYQSSDTFTTNANTTLYAVWKANSTTLSLKSTNSAVISTGGEMKYFTFIPNVNDKYVIYSTGSDDTKVYLYNENGTELDSNDDGGEGKNFRLEYNLTAGKKYTFGVRYYNSSKTGTISFKFGNVYTVTYNANNGAGSPSAQSKDYGTNITLSSTVPTRSGYTFLGWSTSSTATSATYQPGDSFTGNSNTTLYAVWKENTYTVSFNANGGSGAPGRQTKYHFSTLTLSSTKPTRTGYTFLGWSTSSTATSATYQSGSSFTSNSDIILYAVWQQNYTVLDVNTANCAVISSGGEMEYFTFTPTESKKYVIYSVSSEDTKVYLYDAAGSTIASDDDSGDDRNFRLEYELSAGTKYTFGVKYYNSSTTGTIYFSFGEIFTVSYNANGGIGAPSAQLQDYDYSITLSSTVPTREGYTFKGWSKYSSATSADYQPGGNFRANANTTLYAVWEVGCANNAHNYSYVVTSAPTSAVSGMLTGNCSICSGTTTITLPRLSTTDYNSSVTSNASCTETGTQRYTWKTTTYGSFYFDVIIPAIEHSYTENVTLPTCTERGYTTYTCSVCAHSYKDSYTEATGVHICDSWITIKEATVFEAGEERQDCINCDYYETRVIPKQECTHDFGDWTVDVSADCTTTGTKSRICTICNEIEEIEIPATGHSYTENVTSPTCTDQGYTTHTCSACANSYKDSYVSPLGHNYLGGSCTRCGTEDPNYEINENDPQFVIENVTANPGSTVQVAVSLKNNPGIWGMDLDVEYDKSKMTLTNVINGTIFSDGEWTPGNLAGNKYILSYEASGFENITSDGVIAILEFTINEDTEVDQFIDVSVSYDAGDIINVEFDDIEIKIVSGGVEVRDFIYGDINGDGLVNKKDSLLMKMYLADNSTVIDMQAADVYADGIINKKDSLLLRQYLAGQDVELGA